jgi:fermentation-respiration switch protein FrsA (DUF1100 family)
MALCDSWFFQPSRTVYDDPAHYGLDYRDVDIAPEHGVRLHGWLFEGRGRSWRRAVVVHCHGNAGNVTGHFPFIAWMPPAGIDVLTFDYRGYGRSSGKPTRRGVIEDGLAATRLGLDLADARGVPLVLFGQSLGGVVAAAAAAREPRVAGVVLDSTFSTYRREAAWVVSRTVLWRTTWKLAGRYLVSSGCDAIDYVGRICPRPLLIMHGRNDQIVDWRQAVELYDAARPPKDLWLTDDCDHCGMWDGEFVEACERFLAFLEQLRR